MNFIRNLHQKLLKMFALWSFELSVQTNFLKVKTSSIIRTMLIQWFHHPLAWRKKGLVKPHPVCPERYVLVSNINIEIQLPFVPQGDVQSTREWWDGHHLAYRMERCLVKPPSTHFLMRFPPTPSRHSLPRRRENWRLNSFLWSLSW